MISIKRNGYSPDELYAAKVVFSHISKQMQEFCDPGSEVVDCKSCPYRRLCLDIQATVSHLEKLTGEGAKTDEN